MSVTARDLISASLRKIGALASGESPEASAASDGLSELNRMLSTWSNDGLLIYGVTEESPITLTAGDPTYTLGTAGDLTTRPMRIEQAFIRDGSTDYPIKIRSLEEYASIRNKSQQSTYPSELYDDGGFPLRTVRLYPVPSAAKSLILYTSRALTSIALIDTVIALPPGYEDAIVYNLAKRQAPEYGRPWTPENDEFAREALASIKRANHRQGYLRVDTALLSKGGRFDMTTGENR